MTRQKSERRIQPQAQRKLGETRGDEHRGGEKATPVNEQTGQLGLLLGTAEERATKVERTDGEAEAGQPASATCAAPKPSSKEKIDPSATMEQVCQRLEKAFQNVASNKGAPGPD